MNNTNIENTKKLFGIIEDTGWNRAIITFVGIILLALVIVLIVVIIKNATKKKKKQTNGDTLEVKNDPFSIKQPENENITENNLNETPTVSLTEQPLNIAKTSSEETKVEEPKEEIKNDPPKEETVNVFNSEVIPVASVKPIMEKSPIMEENTIPEIKTEEIAKIEEPVASPLDDFRIKEVVEEPKEEIIEEIKPEEVSMNSVVEEVRQEEPISLGVLPTKDLSIDSEDDEKVVVTKQEEMSIMNPNTFEEKTEEKIESIVPSEELPKEELVIETISEEVSEGAVEKFCSNCGNKEVTLGEVCSVCGSKF